MRDGGRVGCAIGIALDGDADRLIVVDELGHVVDGDQLMATIAAAGRGAGGWPMAGWWRR